MPQQRRNDWSVHVYGDRREEDIELDLLAQIVVMLGWQLQRETLADENGLDDADAHD